VDEQEFFMSSTCNKY